MDLLLILLLLVLAGFVAARVVRRRERTAVAARVNELRGIVQEDITEFGERLSRFDLTDPRLDDEARADLQRALDGYDIARNTADRMTSEADTGRVTRALEDGRYALACVDARMSGRAIPERRPPCMLDPTHGPSSEDLPWSIDGRPAEPTPMCVSCAATVRRGELPQPRLIPDATGARTPWYSAGRNAQPYAAGYYSPFSGLMPALFMGTMLGSMMMPMDMNGSYDAGYADGLQAGDGGDAGGGDFGGGDFGGGGFGDFGGDFSL